MFESRLTAILLTLTALASGSITMANAQDKPPLLMRPSAQEYGQMPPPPQPRAMPLVSGRQVPPPPPPSQRIAAPHGEVELNGAVLYDETVVAILHFNQTDGSLLPLGVHPAVYGTTTPIDEIKRNLSEIVRKLIVLQGAEYREPESSWIVPLAYHGMIATHIKVYTDGIHIVPDYRANHQEMQTYRR